MIVSTVAGCCAEACPGTNRAWHQLSCVGGNVFALGGSTQAPNGAIANVPAPLKLRSSECVSFSGRPLRHSSDSHSIKALVRAPFSLNKSLSMGFSFVGAGRRQLEIRTCHEDVVTFERPADFRLRLRRGWWRRLDVRRPLHTAARGVPVRPGVHLYPTEWQQQYLLRYALSRR